MRKSFSSDRTVWLKIYYEFVLDSPLSRAGLLDSSGGGAPHSPSDSPRRPRGSSVNLHGSTIGLPSIEPNSLNYELQVVSMLPSYNQPSILRNIQARSYLINFSYLFPGGR